MSLRCRSVLLFRKRQTHIFGYVPPKSPLPSQSLGRSQDMSPAAVDISLPARWKAPQTDRCVPHNLRKKLLHHTHIQRFSEMPRADDQRHAISALPPFPDKTGLIYIKVSFSPDRFKILIPDPYCPCHKTPLSDIRPILRISYLFSAFKAINFIPASRNPYHFVV